MMESEKVMTKKSKAIFCFLVNIISKFTEIESCVNSGYIEK